MKGKKTEAVVEAMKTFLAKAKLKPHGLTTDKGSEFISATWKKLLKDNSIKHYLADEGDHRKMGMIERFNRTIKLLISKYQTTYKTKKWIDALPDLLLNYNSNVHSTTGFVPNNVGSKEMAIIRLDALQKTAKLDKEKNVNVGDNVRVLLQKDLFGKEGPRYSDTVHKVTEDNVKSFKVDGERKRYKHYEVLKVIDPAGENPYPRKVTSFDLEQHLNVVRQAPRREGEGALEPSPPEPRTTRSQANARQQSQGTRVIKPKAAATTPSKAVTQKMGQTKKKSTPKAKKTKRQVDDEQYYIDKIIAHKESPDGSVQYKVRFVGFGPKDDLWYYKDDLLQTTLEIVADYERNRKRSRK